jgi:heptose I phosphotransferase
MALRGAGYRDQKGRLTQRIVIGGNAYFIKQHHGVGWKEILKNIVQLRWPVISAKNEWRAIAALKASGVSVPEVVGYGERGWNPARRESFIIMEELAPTVSLETLCETWQQHPPAFAVKCKLIETVAKIARIMHEQGMNHRDFYLCHFLLDTSGGAAAIQPAQIKLSLIDLHRAQIRRATPERWLIKDLAGLYFSSQHIGLTQRDLYRFMKHYRGKSLREIMAFETETVFWQKVKIRGNTYRDHTKS